MQFVCVKIAAVTVVDHPEAGNFDARRDVIAATAATLFRQRGFNGVGIDDIGAAIGLTGPAIFHYFAGKQALLTAAADRLLSQLETALDVPNASAETTLRRVVSAAVALPDALAVSLRQLGHLDPGVREPIATRMQRVAVEVCGLGTQRDSIHLRARAAGGALIGLGLAKKPVGVVPAVVAAEVVQAILDTPLPTRAIIDTRMSRDDVRARAARAFRYEAILAAAAHLFHERGFNGVSLDDIGAVVGVTGSAVSRRFGSKDELLAAAFARLGDQLGALFYRTLSEVSDPATGVEEVLRSYVDVAVGSRRLMCLNLSETHRLPEADRLARRKRQRAYVAELAFLLTESQPDLSMAEAKLRARVAFVVISEVVNSDDLARREGLVDDLTVLAMSVLRHDRVGP